MEIEKSLSSIGLDSSNAIVIGSGILEALGVRTINDIDLVVLPHLYDDLKQTGRYIEKWGKGKMLLVDSTFEIGSFWCAIGTRWDYQNLLPYTTIIQGVRYNTLEFLIAVKRDWASRELPRKKDIDDVKLIERYLRSHRGMQVWPHHKYI